MPDCGAGPAGRPVGAPLAADVLRPARAPAPPYLPKQPGYRKRLKAAALLLAAVMDYMAREVPSWQDQVRLIDASHDAFL
jgi:hypothetical protein